ADQLFRRPAIAAEQERLAVAVIPPFAAGIGLVPPSADASFAGAAVVEKRRHLARLGPIHLHFPFVGTQAAAANVVLDDIGRMFAFDVRHFAIDDDAFFL